MNIAMQLSDVVSRVVNSEKTVYSTANNLLFLHFLFELQQNFDVAQFPYQQVEYSCVGIEKEEPVVIRERSIKLWEDLNIKNVNAGGRFLNDCFLYLHNKWLIDNSKQIIESPYDSVIRILERGGYIWKYHGEYQVGEKTIAVRHFVNNDLIFKLPTLKFEFLDYIDQEYRNGEILTKNEAYAIYDRWQSTL